MPSDASVVPPPRLGASPARKFRPQAWWRLVDLKIGIIPLPVYVVLVALLAILTWEGEIEADAPTMIAVLVLGGFTCAEIGNRLPIVSKIGAGRSSRPPSRRPWPSTTSSRRRSRTGEGRLQPGHENEAPSAKAEETAPDAATIAAAGLTAITLYLLGVMLHHVTSLPAPVAMLFLAVLAKLSSAVSPRLQAGGFVAYKFVQTSMTDPLLFAIGVSLTPWDKLVAAFTLENVITIVATVTTLIVTGFFVGRMLGMYPIETAIVNACHIGQGGTGDVAIITAADRMALMPFSQIATRIGGALTVTGALLVLGWIGR